MKKSTLGAIVIIITIILCSISVVIVAKLANKVEKVEVKIDVKK